MTVRHQDQLARSACDFLSEMLRTRAVSLERGAEIAEALISRLDNIRTENDFLSAVRELEFDFQELKSLSKELNLHAKISERQEMEQLVRDFAAYSLQRDPKRALQIMEEALLPEASLDWLLRKYPELEQYHEQERKK